MMRLFALLAFSALTLGSAFAEQSRPVLVELFANQNCPACPRAHKTMQQINEERDDVFILTWTVNYWDYLGEPDPMSLPAAKERQTSYTDNLSLRAPYTPQSFYDGAKECPGTKKRQVKRNIEGRLKQQTDLGLHIVQDGTTVRISGEHIEGLELTLVEYLSGDANDTAMVNPVMKSARLGPWEKSNQAFEAVCERSCAILLHKQNFGEVLAVQPLS